jgi:hypothetical protein
MGLYVEEVPVDVDIYRDTMNPSLGIPVGPI